MQVVGEKNLPRAGAPVSQTNGRTVPQSWRATKRALDLTLSVVAIVVTAPIVIAASLAVSIVTGGAPFFAQERVGRFGRRFRMYKLRTMVPGAHEMRGDVLHLNEASGPVFKIREDPRLHPLGGFLRRTSIDELPNLWNVVRGEMSLVGPRPPLPSEVEHYDEHALRRLSVKPGITCLWQISGRSALSFDQWMELDNRYIDTWSPALDLRILLLTIPAVLRKDGAH
ncbi:MAG: glycosyl transferase [Candidatus Meridianibacter frigidus]|nr:MAG: glycosyl transferase [Candidatus Eremiobacteraeota bacterium]